MKVQCPQCKSFRFKILRQIKGMDAALWHCEECKRVFRVTMDKRQAHTEVEVGGDICPTLRID